MPVVASIGYEAPLARFLVTNLDSEAVTFLERIALSADCTHTLNAPFEMNITVPSDHPQVNLHADAVDPTHTQPYIDEGLNLIYWFLRWGDPANVGNDPWQIQGAAMVMSISDAGADGNPVTTINAFDPWKLLYHIPFITSTGDDLVDHFIQSGTRASEIVLAAIQRAENGTLALNPGPFDTRIDIDLANIADTDPLVDHMVVTAGTSVGELFDSLVAQGGIDIYLKPIFDPITRPGKLAELHVYTRKGTLKPEAIFSWDRWPRSAMSISRAQDGTERANVLQYWAGDGGPPAIQQRDNTSVTKYGAYYEMQSWPGESSALLVENIGIRELRLRKNGKFDYTLTPAMERAPKPFKEYDIGDQVPVWASRRLRRVVAGQNLRVQSIPMSLVEDQLMQVQELTVSIDDEA